MKKRKTAGELSLKAASDSTKYDPFEVAHAITEDVGQQLEECIARHNPIFNEEEYCIGYVLASDPLIKGVMRKKFFAMLYLPSPRPEQAIFLYNKTKHKIEKRLWALPRADKMAILSEMTVVPKGYELMKGWCDAFFAGKFWQHIRQQHNINMLSEIEYLNAHREELIKSGCKEVDPSFSQPFDFSKVTPNKIISSNNTFTNK